MAAFRLNGGMIFADNGTLYSLPNDASDGPLLPFLGDSPAAEVDNSHVLEEDQTAFHFDEPELVVATVEHYFNSDADQLPNNDDAQFFESFFDTTDAEAENDSVLFAVDSAPVGANAVIVAAMPDIVDWFELYDQPEIEEFEWTPYQPMAPPDQYAEDISVFFEEEISFTVIEGSYQQTSDSTLFDDPWDWSQDDTTESDWQVIIDDDDDQVGGDAVQYFGDEAETSEDDASSAPHTEGYNQLNGEQVIIEDAWDWSAEEPDEDIRAFLDADIVGADAIGVASLPFDEAWDHYNQEEATDDWLDDRSHVSGSGHAFDDPWEYSEDDYSPPPFFEVYFQSDADQLIVEDAWDWSAEEPEDDLRLALDADPIGSNAVIVSAITDDAWDWTQDDLAADDWHVITDDDDDAVGPDAAPPALIYDDISALFDEDIHFTIIDGFYQQVDAQPFPVEDAWDWSPDDASDDQPPPDDYLNTSAVVAPAFAFEDISVLFDEDIAPTVVDDYYQQADAPATLIEDAWDWSSDDASDEYLPPDDMAGANAVVAPIQLSEDQIFEDDADDDLWIEDYANFDADTTYIEDAWEWAAEGVEADDWSALLVDPPVGANAAVAAPVIYEDISAMFDEEMSFTLIESAYQQADADQFVDSVVEFQDDAFDTWEIDLPSEPVGVNATVLPIQLFEDPSAEDEDPDDFWVDDYANEEIPPYALAEDVWDWSLEDTAADDWQIILDDDDDGVSQNAQPFPVEDAWDWGADDASDDQPPPDEFLGASAVVAASQLFSEAEFEDDSDDDLWIEDYANFDAYVPLLDDAWNWNHDDSVEDDWQVIIDDDDDEVGPSAQLAQVFDDPWLDEDVDQDIETPEFLQTPADPIQFYEDGYDLWSQDADDETFAFLELESVVADNAYLLIPIGDEYDWSAEEPDEDIRAFLDADPVGPNVPPTLPEDAWDWSAEEPEDDLRLAINVEPVGLNYQPLIVEDAWDWSAEEPEDDLRAALDLDPVGSSASPFPVEDAWDWGSEEPEDDLRASLDTDPVGINQSGFPVEDAFDWSAEEPDEDFRAFLNTETVGPSYFQVYEDPWDWSAEEPEEELRLGLYLETAQPPGVPLQFYEDGWDFWSQDADDDSFLRIDTDIVVLDNIYRPLGIGDAWDWSQDDSEFDDSILLMEMASVGTGYVIDCWVVYADEVRNLAVHPTGPRYFVVSAQQRDVTVTAAPIRQFIVSPSATRHFHVGGTPRD